MSADRIVDPALGEFTWNADLSWWEGSEASPGSRPFQLYMHPASGETRDITPAARRAATRILGAESEIRQYAAEGLLKIHNESWNEGTLITEDEFAGRLTPGAAVLYPDGYAEVGFADGGLFWDHEVVVQVDPGGSYQTAEIQG